MAEAQGSRTSRLSAKARNDQKWETHKDNIRSVYMDMDHTLKDTMQIISHTYQFKASERKWKEKLKSWKFEKNVSSAAMGILIAKSEKRKREEGKETQFFHGGAEIKKMRLESFKKRRVVDFLDAVSPTAETPVGITYCTPGPETPRIPTALENFRDKSLEPLDDMLPTTRLTVAHLSDSESTSEVEVQTFLPDPSGGRGERNMLIQTIAGSSMLWNCPERGLHTIDEESVLGLEEEDLAPSIVSDLIANHIDGARMDRKNRQIKSAAVKYLGSIILAIERQCCSTEALLEYISEFLEFLEAGPGACVTELQELDERPEFELSKYSDVCLLYHEALTLLREEFERTSEVVARICLLMANLETLYPEMSHHAETLYGVAIEGYQKMQKFDDLLQCQVSLADVLLNLNRSSDAYELLARECGRYLHDHVLFRDGTSPTTLYNLTSLSSGVGVRSSIVRIKRILSDKKRISRRNFERNEDLDVRMIHEIAVLGGILSTKASQSDSVLYLEALDPLWSAVFNKLSFLDDVEFASLKAFVYIQRSNYLCNGFNLFRHLNCLDDIRVAYKYLATGGLFQLALRDQFICHVDSLRQRAMNIPHLRTLDMMDAFSIGRLADLSESPRDSERPRDLVSDLEVGRLSTCSFNPWGGDAAPADNAWMKEYGVRFSDARKIGLVFTD
ncbi:uncharacterized protein LY89DRAFT_718116 [Mollisia scopiformis]|uniref:Clr5 domain-containing protein n=1 Tax=Mollisia scopiformis TaxID=149040 RepID=A0A194XB68_MOLSC|nr:uncharacterized protein LY89DRAFT_718116 [Mollisia scopiformis]KUJ17416.1 hypothetical protein LY89DRAFT_718116 [Mollisia scopiformis]